MVCWQLILNPIPLFHQTWSKPSSSAPTSMKAPKCLTPVTCQHWKMIDGLDASFRRAESCLVKSLLLPLILPLFTYMWFINVKHSYHSSHRPFVTFKCGFQQLRENPWPDPAILLLKKICVCQPGHWTKVCRRWKSQNMVDGRNPAVTSSSW